MKTRVASAIVATNTRAAYAAHGRSHVRAYAVAVCGSDHPPEYFDNAWLANGQASRWAGLYPGMTFLVFENVGCSGKEVWEFATSYEADPCALPKEPKAQRALRIAAQRAMPKIIYRKRQEATA
jgi:hypothetical protein